MLQSECVSCGVCAGHTSTCLMLVCIEPSDTATTRAHPSCCCCCSASAQGGIIPVLRDGDGGWRAEHERAMRLPAGIDQVYWGMALDPDGQALYVASNPSTPISDKYGALPKGPWRGSVLRIPLSPGKRGSGRRGGT